MGMLLASPEPLPTEELRRVNDWDENETEDFLSRISPLLRRDTNVFQKETAAFSHSFLPQWLDSPEAGAFRTSANAARREMSKQYYNQFHEGEAELSGYAALHLAEFLEADGNRKKLEEVRGSTDLLAQLGSMGDFCWGWGDTDMALLCYERARDMAVYKMNIRGNEQDCWHLMKCCDSLERVFRETGDTERLDNMKSQFRELYEQAEKRISRRNVNVKFDEDGMIGITEPDEENGFQETVLSFEQLMQESGDIVRLRVFYNIYHNLANSMREAGKLNQALEAAQKCLTIAKRLVQETDRTEDKRRLVNGFLGIGFILHSLGTFSRAMEQHQTGLSISEQLAHNPGELYDCRTLISNYTSIADVLREVGKTAQALEMYHKGRATLERIPQKKLTPDDRAFLATIDMCIGISLTELDKPQEAFAWYQKALTIIKGLAQKRRTLDDLDKLGGIYIDIGSYYLTTENLRSAQDQLEKALPLTEQVMQKRGTLDDQRTFSLVHYNIAETKEQSVNLGEPEEQSGDMAEERKKREEALSKAREHYETAMSGLAAVVRDRNSPDDQRDAAACRHKLADLRWEAWELDADLRWNAGEANAVRDTYVNVREIYENVAQVEDSPMDWQYICVSDNNLAAVLEETGDLDGALDAYRRDLSTAETLAERWGAPMDQESLAVSCWNIAQFSHAPLDERFSCARRGLELTQALIDSVGEQVAKLYKPLYEELAEDFRNLLAELEAMT